MLSCAGNKGQLTVTACVIQFITRSHQKHKTRSSIGGKVGLPCPGGECVCAVCMNARACAGLQSHRDLCAGGPTAGGPAEFGRVEVSWPIRVFFMVN